MSPSCARLLPEAGHDLTDPPTSGPVAENPAKSGAQPLGAMPTTSAQKPGAARTRLLLEGPIVSTLLRLAAPNLVVNVVLIAVTASVDAHFVGELNSSALAGLSLVFPMMNAHAADGQLQHGRAIRFSHRPCHRAGRREDAAALVIHGW